MRHFIFGASITLFLISSLSSAGQDDYPVDVVYHENTGRYFLANWREAGNGSIFEIDENGNVLNTFYDDVAYPGGMSIVGDVLYVVHNLDLVGGYLPSYLVGVDITTGTEVLNRFVSSDGCYLDLMDTDGSNLYFGDEEQNQIYKYNIPDDNLVSIINVTHPYGVCFDHINNRLIFTESNYTQSFLKSANPDGSGVQSLMAFEGFLEGIVMDHKGRFYYSSWGNDAQWGNESVYTNNSDFSEHKELSTGHNRPFGMCITPDKELIVCNWGGNSLSFLDISQYLGTPEAQADDEHLLSLFPNPTEGVFSLVIHDLAGQTLDISIRSTEGRLIREKRVKTTSSRQEIGFDLSGIPEGIYIISVKAHNHNMIRKLIVK